MAPRCLKCDREAIGYPEPKLHARSCPKRQVPLDGSNPSEIPNSSPNLDQALVHRLRALLDEALDERDKALEMVRASKPGMDAMAARMRELLAAQFELRAEVAKLRAARTAALEALCFL